MRSGIKEGDMIFKGFSLLHDSLRVVFSQVSLDRGPDHLRHKPGFWMIEINLKSANLNQIVHDFLFN